MLALAKPDPVGLLFPLYPNPCSSLLRRITWVNSRMILKEEARRSEIQVFLWESEPRGGG